MSIAKAKTINTRASTNSRDNTTGGGIIGNSKYTTRGIRIDKAAARMIANRGITVRDKDNMAGKTTKDRAEKEADRYDRA